jgi:Phenol hydroxylase, C-terminal dimerisation domain
VQRYFVRHGHYTAGTATKYQPSLISAGPRHQHLAKGLVIGMRFHSASVVRLSDAKPVRLGDTIKADGRWRIFVFADAQAPSALSSLVKPLCDFLTGSTDSPVRRYTPAGADIDSVIDVRAIFQQRHRDLNLESMPQLLLPTKGRYALRDYQKIFCSDHRGSADIFDLRSIDRERGCAVVVRPDQYVANVLPLDAYTELSVFFDGFMLLAA